MNAQLHHTAVGARDGELTQARIRPAQALVGGIVFLGAYLTASPVAGALSDRAAPRPGEPAPAVAAYLEANQAATLAVASLQALSVIGFAVFIVAVMPAIRAANARAASRLRVAGMMSVAAMLVASAIGGAAALLASSVSAETVGALRMANFYAGGVTNVAILGLFVYSAARVLGHSGLLGRPTKWFGYVSGVPAMLSLLSIAFYYANAFLPIGRLLCMVWTVVTAIVLLRRNRSASRPNTSVQA